MSKCIVWDLKCLFWLWMMEAPISMTCNLHTGSA